MTSNRRSHIADVLDVSDRRMMPNMLGCSILGQDTGKPLFTLFFDEELRKNPTLMAQRMKAGQIRMVHEFGKQNVFTAFVTHETPEAKEYLRALRDRVEKAFPDGLQEGRIYFLDVVLLQNIFKEVFVDNKK